MAEYLTVTEIVNDILYNLHEKDREYLLALPKSDLIKLHSTWGQHIRNFYRLWDAENPTTLKNYEPDYHHINGVDVDCNPKHPDIVSSQIMSEVWLALHTTPFAKPTVA